MHTGVTRGGRPLGSVVGLLVLVAATSLTEGAAAADPGIPGVASGSRLRAMFADGGDGALAFRGWFDKELGFPCTFSRTPNGQMRCMPSSQQGAVFFDSTCTAHVWGAACPTAPLPRYVTEIVPGPAGVAYALGEPYSGAVRDIKNGGYCSDYVRGSGPFGWSWSYYGLGAEIPYARLVAGTVRIVPIGSGAFSVRTLEGEDGSSFVEVSSRVVKEPWRYPFPPGTFTYSGSGRLRVPLYAVGDGQVVPAMLGEPFFDTQADALCQVDQFADGLLRCVPRSVASVSDEGPYADPACTELLHETRPAFARLPAPTPGSPAITRGVCPRAATYTLGEVVTPSVVYFKESTCRQKAPTRGAVYRPATPAPDSQWPPVTEGME